MTVAAEFEEINEVKANMDDIYNQADPRAYFGELKKLAYSIPGVAKPLFRKLIGDLKRRRHGTVNILDLGCSYGVNAALLKYDLSMRDLYNHWDQERLVEATPEELVEREQRFFSDLGEPKDIEVIGIDQAENAIAFSEEVGLLDGGVAANLESEPVPASAEKDLASVDLLISTGCVGYVTERTFERLLPAITRNEKPWIANFVLRMFPFDAIEDTLSDWGYVTEKLEGETFIQRNFASPEEQEQVLEQLRTRGIDPTEQEMKGSLLAEFYLSRPKKDVAEAPMAQLVLA